MIKKTIEINGINFTLKKMDYFSNNGYDIFDLYKRPSQEKIRIYEYRKNKIYITGLTGNSCKFVIYGEIADENKKRHKVKITADNNYILY